MFRKLSVRDSVRIVVVTACATAVTGITAAGSAPAQAASVAHVTSPAAAEFAARTVPAARVAATTSTQFQGVSCTMAQGCLAVGSWFSSADEKLYALAETRAPGSSTWTVHNPPHISGALSTAFGPIGNGETVSCVSTPKAMCMAIGSFSNASGQSNYAAMWSWPGWRTVNPPNPSPTRSSGLDAVRCVSSSYCVTIGHWVNSSTGKEELEGAVWNGTSWSAKPMPPAPSGNTGVRLWGLSCRSTTWCLAVGDYNTGSGPNLKQLTLSEVWNGKTWTMHLGANPAGQNSNALLGVSCTSTTSCVAVGNSLTPKLTLLSLSETWNGKTWTVRATPGGKQSIGGTLFDVSCQSATFCLSVGTLAATWNGTKWTSVPFPTPSGAQVTNAVSLACLSATSCTSAGGYSTKTATLPLVLNWNGQALTIQKARTP